MVIKLVQHKNSIVQRLCMVDYGFYVIDYKSLCIVCIVCIVNLELYRDFIFLLIWLKSQDFPFFTKNALHTMHTMHSIENQGLKKKISMHNIPAHPFITMHKDEKWT